MKRNIEDFWDIDALRDFRTYKVTAQIMGVWPFTCQETFSKTRFFSIIIILTSMAAMLVQDILRNCGTINEALESAVFVPSALLGILKITLPRIYWKNMKSIILSTAQDWSTTTCTQSRKIMGRSSVVSTAGFLFLLGGSLSISVLAVLRKAALNFRLNSENSTIQYVALGAGCWRSDLPMNIYLIYATQSIQLCIMQLCVNGSDACYYQILSHLSGQLNILKLNLEGSINSYDGKSSPIDAFVKQHNRLLRLCYHVEETFTFVVLCHLMTNLCFIMMIVLTSWSENEERGNLVIFGCTTIFFYGQMFLFCFGGDVITTRTEALFHSVYSYPWYKLKVFERQKVLFILTKTNYPMHFTACKLYRLNLENFKNIVKFTASLFSFMRLFLQK
ncbi:odorant receptor 46a-like [Diachasma alloeum]|uniref:Odorant receptor n=1 Tax=Diachasma alloeum TaxID=454923 RepID=A0A4E0RK48_9HYME|nr:odorant receptor 46a-like [Diachasma alloeum]THK33122.1 odorant receptor 71 [Diachasma alloeum]